MTGQPTHGGRAHAELSASSSDRWLNCPGSIRACRGMKKASSEFAAEGTAAHQLAEKCLRDGSDAEEHLGDIIEVAGDEGTPEGWEFEVNDDMVEAVQFYLDFVRPKMEGKEYEIEQRVDLSSFYPGMFGTVDLEIYDESNGILDINDYKHGRGVAVDAEDNFQLLYYAIGSAIRKGNRGVKKIRVHIIQPRCPHAKGRIRSVEITPSDLIDRRADLIEGATRTENPNAALIAGGWCADTFCPRLGNCHKFYERVLTMAQDAAGNLIEPHTWTSEEISKRLALANELDSWLKAFRAFAKSEANAGRTPKGWKLVWKRARRKWLNEDTLADKLANFFGLEGDDVFTKKLKSPAQMEKLLPKDMREKLNAFVSKESSGTTLVAEDDPREAVKPAIETVFKAVQK